MTPPKFPNQQRYRHMVKDELLQILGGKSPEGPKTEDFRRELPRPPQSGLKSRTRRKRVECA